MRRGSASVATFFICVASCSDVQPKMMEDITDRVCCVTEQVWRALHKRFGGGPAVTHLQPCGTCIQKAKLLEERRSAEREKYVEVSRLLQYLSCVTSLCLNHT